tara:strand:- start:20 stop:286 length:267 start_codon:yes stop_codon:yes gene_type:complete
VPQDVHYRWWTLSAPDSAGQSGVSGRIQTNRDTVATTLKAASLTADQFDSEESTMNSLRNMSESADGQVKALQVGHEIAARHRQLNGM